jgi:hypothetical protein
MMQQYIPQQNMAQQAIYALTQLMYALMPLAMMSSMTTGIFTQLGWTEEDRRTLELEFGKWAGDRALSMIPPAAGLDAARAAASHMLERYKATIGAPAAPKAAPPTRRARVPRAPGEVTLTEREIDKLASDAKDFYGDMGRKPNVAEVRTWAEDMFKKKITADDVAKVMRRAFP